MVTEDKSLQLSELLDHLIDSDLSKYLLEADSVREIIDWIHSELGPTAPIQSRATGEASLTYAARKKSNDP